MPPSFVCATAFLRYCCCCGCRWLRTGPMMSLCACPLRLRPVCRDVVRARNRERSCSVPAGTQTCGGVNRFQRILSTIVIAQLLVSWLTTTHQHTHTHSSDESAAWRRLYSPQFVYIHPSSRISNIFLSIFGYQLGKTTRLLR